MITDNPYEELDPSHLVLRDHLAIDRTVLANERTFLAYTRTALALLIVGATLLHFIDEGVVPIVGAAFIGIGGVVQIVGVVQFLRMRRRLAAIRRE